MSSQIVPGIAIHELTGEIATATKYQQTFDAEQGHILVELQVLTMEGQVVSFNAQATYFPCDHVIDDET
jgi:hypothetical protein